MGLFDELLETALAAVGSVIVTAVAAALVCKIVETVAERITKSNIVRLIRQAIINSKQDKAKQLLKEAIKGVVKEKKPQTISVSLFNDDGKEAAQIQLTSPLGVDEGIAVGMHV